MMSIHSIKNHFVTKKESTQWRDLTIKMSHHLSWDVKNQTCKRKDTGVQKQETVTSYQQNKQRWLSLISLSTSVKRNTQHFADVLPIIIIQMRRQHLICELREMIFTGVLREKANSFFLLDKGSSVIMKNLRTCSHKLFKWRTMPPSSVYCNSAAVQLVIKFILFLQLLKK